MAELVERYRKECGAFNRTVERTDLSDDEFHRLAADTFNKTEKRIRRAPILTKDDALAALKFIEREIDDAGALDFIKPLFKALRDYIKGGQA
jgi:hypothetical protein